MKIRSQEEYMDALELKDLHIHEGIRLPDDVTLHTLLLAIKDYESYERELEEDEVVYEWEGIW